MGTREIVRLLWPSDCQLRHVSVSYLRETLQACTSTTTATRHNAKLHTRTCTRSPSAVWPHFPLSLVNKYFSLLNGLWFLCMEFVANCWYLDILIRWLQWLGTHRQLMLEISPDKQDWNPDPIFLPTILQSNLHWTEDCSRFSWVFWKSIQQNSIVNGRLFHVESHDKSKRQPVNWDTSLLQSREK